MSQINNSNESNSYFIFNMSTNLKLKIVEITTA